MIRSIPDDYLSRLTRRALSESMAEAQATGRIWPRIVYTIGTREWTFRLRFEDFLALAVSGHGRHDVMQGLLGAMGFAFFHVTQTLGEINEVQPHRLAEARSKWDATVFCLLRGCGPRFVVIVDLLAVRTPGVPSPDEPPAITAIGLHPAGWVGFASACREEQSHRIDFGAVSVLKEGAVHAHALRNYLRLFVPEKN